MPGGHRRRALEECVGCGGPALPGCALCDHPTVIRYVLKNGRTATKYLRCRRHTYCAYCDGFDPDDDRDPDEVAFSTR